MSDIQRLANKYGGLRWVPWPELARVIGIQDENLCWPPHPPVSEGHTNE